MFISCKSAYKQTNIVTGLKLDANGSVYVVVPEDGGFGNKVYRGSGQKTAMELENAFSMYTDSVESSSIRILEKPMKYYAFEIVIEKESEDEGYCAYSPTLPGCFGNGKTIEEAKRNIHEAVQQHITSLREHDQPDDSLSRFFKLF